MNNRLLGTARAALVLPLGLVILAACNSGPQPTEQVIKTADGEAVIDTYTIDATVAAVDPVKRKVTLMSADGKTTTFTARKDQDLNRIQPGDWLRATLTEEVAVSLRKGDAASLAASEISGAAVAGNSSESAALIGDQVEVSAKVTDIDTAKRKVTLQLPDGTSKTIKAGKDIDLSKVGVGDTVVVQVTKALAIDVQHAGQ
jgi:hypothetical protein